VVLILFAVFSGLMDSTLVHGSQVQDSESGMEATTNQISKSRRNRFHGLNECDKEKIRERYLEAKIFLKNNPSISASKEAKHRGLDIDTLLRVMSGKILIENIGKIGRRSALTKIEEVGFMEAVSNAGQRGQWMNREEFAAAAHQYAVTKGRFSQDRKPLSISYSYAVSRRHPECGLSLRKVKERDEKKMNVLDASIFREYFNSIAKLFSSLSYPEIRGDSGEGIPSVPSCSVFAGDEVAICAYRDGAQYGLALRNEQPKGSNSSGANFHITLMLTVCLSGYAIPSFIIFSNNCELAYANKSIFTGVNPDATFTSNESGSMRKSIGYEGADGFESGTFLEYCKHFVKYAHIMSQMDERKHKLVLFLDNHGSRQDPTALEYLESHNVILKTIPENSSFILQVGDTQSLNMRVQGARKTIVSDWKKRKVNITPEIVARSLPAILSQITPEGIFLAAETVGFHFDPNSIGGTSRLVMSPSCVEKSVAKFKSYYLNDDEANKKRIEEQNNILECVKTMHLSW
jgi:hypothetical protein